MDDDLVERAIKAEYEVWHPSLRECEYNHDEDVDDLYGCYCQYWKYSDFFSRLREKIVDFEGGLHDT